ncbi:MAG: hypothetical protein IJD43_10240 [Thermoguttaceae bacterium]|nr:hypothetical protein [Thermoguttaceae bacterium]
MILESKFPAEFTEAEREKIQKITDLEQLDKLMQSVIFAASYSEITSLF